MNFGRIAVMAPSSGILKALRTLYCLDYYTSSLLLHFNILGTYESQQHIL